jgi:hypothetical protein
MIALLALITMATTPRIVEIPCPDANRLAVQVMIKLPELDSRELAFAQILEANLLEGTEDFTKNNLLLMTSKTGHPIRCILAPDHLRIQFSLPENGLSNASLIIDSILRRALLDPEKIKASSETLPFRNLPYWSEALDFRKSQFPKLKQSEVVGFYHHLFRPENVTIAVSGPFEPGKAEEAIKTPLVDWIPGRDDYPKFHYADMPIWSGSRRRSLTTFEIYSMLPDGELPKQLTIASVLGLGKGSLVFRIIREKMRISYRQEAFLWPSEKGLQLRIIVAYSQSADAQELAEKVRAELLKAVDLLDESDLSRAQTLFTTSWQNGIVSGPMLIGSSIPLGNSLEDRTLLAGYGTMKTDAPWLYDKLIDDVRSVGLADVKKTARALLESAKVRVIKGD